MKINDVIRQEHITSKEMFALDCTEVEYVAQFVFSDCCTKLIGRYENKILLTSKTFESLRRKI